MSRLSLMSLLLLVGCHVFDASLVETDGGLDAARDASTDASTDTSEDTTDPDAPGDAGVLDAPTLDAMADAGADAADASADAPDATLCVPSTDGVWVWDPTVLSEDTDTNLMRIANAGFGRVFVEAEAFATDETGAIVDIVAAAAAHCIEVELLLGYAPWSYTPMHGYIRRIVREALAQFAPGDIMPRAIHLDVEPHTLPEWADEQGSVAEQWVSMLEGVATECGDVPLIADVPFWYHEVRLERGGEDLSLLHWTLRATDGVTILAYRDTAQGPNGIVELSRPSLMIADEVGGSVGVGLETHCGVEPTHVTFCEEGRAVFEAESSRARSFLAPYGSFAGIAVHSWSSFQTLVP